MSFELYTPDAIKMHDRSTFEFRFFLQAMVNRRAVGALRYGDPPQRRQRYMTRMAKELEAYRKEGNFEQLLNIAMYAFLESAAPENPKLHFDPSAASVTRAEFGV